VSKPSFPAKPIKKQTLAERVAEDIADLILQGGLGVHSALPSEAQLAKQYGVSQSVIRNASHLLAARGLVEARHGKGVYVTPSQREAFGDALLLSLQRAGATVWDLEEFEQLLFPAVAALASSNATDEELEQIRHAAFTYIDQLQEQAEAAESVESVEGPFAHILNMIYGLTHNEVVRQIGEQLVSLRRSREWSGIDAKQTLEMDRNFLTKFLAILEIRDTKEVRERTEKLMKLPAAAIEAMKNTPIGQIPEIDAASVDERWKQEVSRSSDS
jgi:GntR family transcriptional repressor for pyruvate dehydrogenase complex